MSSDTSGLKRHNHIVHPCKDDAKTALLQHIIKQKPTQTIYVIANDTKELKELLSQHNISLYNDEELQRSEDLQCELLISYDLPDSAESYLQRITHTDKAIILLAETEHKKLYPIETLLKRALKQEQVEGFETTKEVSQKSSQKSLKKKKPASKYLGKDKNGKAIFSAKSGERNHRYDGTPKSENEKVSSKRRKGKKISIKAIKPKKEEEQK